MATERIEIVVTDRGTRQVKRNLDGLGRSAGAASKGVGLLKGALGGLALGAAFAKGISILASFGQEMSTVKGVTNATGAEFDALKAKAQELGATTRFSATQAAEGMTFLARAGFDANEVLGSIQATLTLAQAGALDLGRAADIASNVLKGFGLENEEASRVVDVLSTTANSANTNVDQLGEAMKFAAPVARGFGVSVEEASAAIGVLGDAGLQGTIAGTGLRTTILKLADPTKQAQETLAELGLTQADVNVETLGLTQVLKNLENANISTSQAFQLVGLRAGTALAVLTKSIPDVEKLTKANQEAAGSAQKMADIMDDNLNGALLAVKSAFEAVILSLGDLGGDSALTSFFRGLASALRTVADNADIFVKSLQAIAIALLTLRAMSAVTAGFYALAVAIRAPIVALRALTIALATTGIGLLVVAFGAAVGAAIAFREELGLMGFGFGELSDTINGVLALFQDFGTLILDAIQSVFPSLGEFRENWSETGSSISDVIILIVDGIDFLVASFVGAKDAVIGAWNNLPGAFIEIAELALNGAIKVVEIGINGIIELINSIPFVDIEGRANFEGVDFNQGQAGPIESGFASGFEGQRGAISGRLAELTALAAKTREATISDEFFTRQLAASDAAAKAATESTAALKETIEGTTTATDALTDSMAGGGGGGAGGGGAVGAVEQLSETIQKEAPFMEDALSAVFDKAGDALSEFITTGEFDFKKFIDGLLQDITRLALESLKSGLFGGGGGGGGGIFGGGGGGGLGGLFSSLGGLFGFAHGGNFTVGGGGGTDSEVVAFRATPGEEVHINKPGEGGGRPIVINMNISTPDAASFQRSQGQISARLQANLQRANSRNN